MPYPTFYTSSDLGDKHLEKYCEMVHDGYMRGFAEHVPNAVIQPWSQLSDEEKHAYRVGVQQLLGYIYAEEMESVRLLIAGQCDFVGLS